MPFRPTKEMDSPEFKLEWPHIEKLKEGGIVSDCYDPISRHMINIAMFPDDIGVEDFASTIKDYEVSYDEKSGNFKIYLSAFDIRCSQIVSNMIWLPKNPHGLEKIKIVYFDHVEAETGVESVEAA